MKQLEIIVEKNFRKAELLVKAGYCPVECSFGDKVVLDSLEMDHHGKMSYMESVAVRAYRDFFGVRANDPRFVVNHIDADCAFAIAALAGLLPHPDSKYARSLPEFKQKRWLQDFLPLAETIAIMDTSPIGRTLSRMPFGKMLITWKTLFAPTADDDLGAIGAVYGFRQLTSVSLAALSPYLNMATEVEDTYKDIALEDMRQRGNKDGSVLLINRSRIYGFSEWYKRRWDVVDAQRAEAWENPLVIAFSNRNKLVFGIPNKEVAEELLGVGGLQNLFAELNNYYCLSSEEGFGGRECIGGSPRGMEMTWDDVVVAANFLNKLVK